MEIIFEETDDITRILYLYNLFGPPDSLTHAMRGTPMLFGETFYNVSKLDLQIRKLPGGYESLFLYLFKEKQSASDSASCKALTEKASFIPVFHDEAWPKAAATFKDEINRSFTSNHDKLEAQLNSIFGFTMPKRIVIAISQNFEANSSSGSRILYLKESDSCYISYRLGAGQNKQTLVGVVLHELLHCLTQKYAIVNKKADREYFEEALLDYFVPDGILSERLGLMEKKDLAYYNSNNTRMRPYSFEMSKRLLPNIEEYCKTNPKGTIWQFLKTRGFEKYIN